MEAAINPTMGEQLMRNKARILRLNGMINKVANTQPLNEKALASYVKERDLLKSQLTKFLES